MLAQGSKVLIIAGKSGHRRCELDRPAEMGDRRVDPPGPTLETGGVVIDRRAVGPVVGEERLGTVSALRVVAGLKQGKQRREQFPAAGLVRLALRPSADREHGRAGVPGERRPLDTRGYVDQCSGWGVVARSVYLKAGVPGH